jgi:hypothetical protein
MILGLQADTGLHLYRQLQYYISLTVHVVGAAGSGWLATHPVAVQAIMGSQEIASCEKLLTTAHASSMIQA